MLADFGADVIRIEPPPGVDPNEAMFAGNRHGGDFQNLNRNKRSLTLNLKREQGREVFCKLAATADVVVENWRPDVKKRLGLDYESLKAINPRIILASISGFGQDGPYASRPGFDQIIQGMSGLMSVTGTPGQGPMRAGLAVGDMSAGLYTAIGILLALAERERSGQGQWVDVSLLHSLIAMMDFQAARYLQEGDEPVQAGNDHPTSSPMGLFEASDGVFNLGSSGEGNWQRLCQALQQASLADHPDFATEALRVRNRTALNRVLDPLFLQRSKDEWITLLNAQGVPCGPVYSVREVFEDEQVAHLGVAQEVGQARVIASPIKLGRTPAELHAAAPNCGEHNDSILKAAGYTQADIDVLRQKGVI